MPQAPTKAVWYLARANERPCPLSTRELLILAELGKLRGDDVIWRSGSGAKQSIRSLLGRTNGALTPGNSLSKETPKAAIPKPRAASADEPAAPETLAIAADEPVAPETLAVAPAAEFEVRGQGRKWALAGALAGVAAVGVCVAVIATVFIYSQPFEPEITQIEAHDAAPVAASGEAPTPPPVTTEEVAVRKVKVLEIPAPPAAQ